MFGGDAVRRYRCRRMARIELEEAADGPTAEHMTKPCCDLRVDFVSDAELAACGGQSRAVGICCWALSCSSKAPYCRQSANVRAPGKQIRVDVNSFEGIKKSETAIALVRLRFRRRTSCNSVTLLGGN
jgi:hypothetical protein